MWKRLSLAVMIAAALSIPSVVSVFATPYGAGTYGSCTYNTCSISISTSGTVALSVSVTSSDRYVIDRDIVTVGTGASSGYTLQIESDSATTSLVGSSQSIAAVSGTVGSPALLSTNTWGYRLDGQGGFGAGPTVTTSSTSSSLTFAGLNANGTPATIKTTSSAASPAQSTDVWYGVRASPTLPSGSYTRTIVYTAITN